MKKIAAKIIENERLTPAHFRMRIESAYLGRAAKPGQFVEVRCSDGREPLLRRPLGVHRIAKGGIELLYEVVGKGTELLSRKRRGEMLDLIGPLGNGFDVRSTIHDPRYTILIAGGIGVAPLLGLAEKLAYSVERIAYSKRKRIVVIIGAKTKSHLLCETDFKKLGCGVLVSTDDGSKGAKGFATDTLKTFLRSTINDERLTIYACGPTPMLKSVAEIAAKYRMRCQVSLEERMACGVGVCLGCPVKVKSNISNFKFQISNFTYKMVCKDGPVFDAEEIAW